MSEAYLPPLPSYFELKAASEWCCIEFISDLHLIESQPATRAAFDDYMASTSADAVYILGDLFEVWVGDDTLRADTWARSVANVLAESAAHRSVGFMAGNRDFLVGRELLQQCGLMSLPDPTVIDAWGRRVLLTHGDSLCLGDVPYQAFRTQVRTASWRSEFLAKPLEERRRIARGMRDASEAAKHGQRQSSWPDVDPAAAVSWMHALGCRDMVHGHTHRPGSESIETGYLRHVLSDWDLDGAPTRAQVLRLTRDGFARQDLAS
jgi:UDP-2,3-diacylglucosamine hydrolase